MSNLPDDVTSKDIDNLSSDDYPEDCLICSSEYVNDSNYYPYCSESCSLLGDAIARIERVETTTRGMMDMQWTVGLIKNAMRKVRSEER